MKPLPKAYTRFMKQHPDIGEAYERLAGLCHGSGPLDDRSRALVKLGIAIGARMEGSVHAQVRKALEAGLKPEEIRHAALMALTTAGFPAMMTALTWVEDVLGARRAPKSRRGEAGRE
jgi:alkylhydroperoxidase/carboxymuconolactone decarboxylase family protein YurZ